MDANQPPSFVQLDRADKSLRVVDARADRLYLQADQDEMQGVINNGGGRATGWLLDGHPIVQFEYGTRRGQTAWRWNLDAECGT